MSAGEIDAAGIRTVAVIGAGAMGSGIAQVAARNGARVTIIDANGEALERGRTGVTASLSALVSRAKLTQERADAIQTTMRWSTDIGDVADSQLVIEAIVEDLTIKQSVFRQVEAVVGADVIIASNTSSLPIARLAKALQRPGRFVGMHFFNPATVMKLVEVVAGPATEPAVTARVLAIATAWEKVAVRAADVPGFIVNRVARPFYAEAFTALQEGIDPGLVDELLRASAGFKMGPLELTDLIGQDVNFAVATSVYNSYFGNTRFLPQLAQAALVDAGWLGRKTGRGVFDYRDGAVLSRPVPLEHEAKLPDIVARLNFDPATEVEAEGVAIRFSRGDTAALEAQRHELPVALLDWFDSSNASAIGFAASDDHAASVAVAAIAGAGKRAYRIADRPGLIVGRILAQIANAAGDAVFERVSDAEGIDAALRYGANYPVGPLAWSDAYGRARLVAFLDALWNATGAAHYRPSQYWKLPK